MASSGDRSWPSPVGDNEWLPLLVLGRGRRSRTIRGSVLDAVSSTPEWTEGQIGSGEPLWRGKTHLGCLIDDTWRKAGIFTGDLSAFDFDEMNTPGPGGLYYLEKVDDHNRTIKTELLEWAAVKHSPTTDLEGPLFLTEHYLREAIHEKVGEPGRLPMGTMVEWYDAGRTTCGVLEKGQSCGENAVTREAAVVFRGDNAAVIEGSREELRRLLVLALEALG